MPSSPAINTTAQKALFDAVQLGDASAMRLALQQGADINGLNSEGETAITALFDQLMGGWFLRWHACSETELLSNVLSMAEEMLAVGADINLHGTDGITALQYACYNVHVEAMTFLLNHGANPNLNFWPEEEPWIRSMPLETIYNEFNVQPGKEEKLMQCLGLLLAAGAQEMDEAVFEAYCAKRRKAEDAKP